MGDVGAAVVALAVVAGAVLILWRRGRARHRWRVHVTIEHGTDDSDPE